MIYPETYMECAGRAKRRRRFGCCENELKANGYRRSVHAFSAPKKGIPKGFCHLAQGWEERATLGQNRGRNSTLKGLQPRVPACPGQAVSATTLSGLAHFRQFLVGRVCPSAPP